MTRHLRAEKSRRGMRIVYFTAEPLDRLFLKFQKLDERQDLLLKCFRTETSPFTQCQLEFSEMLREDPSQGALSPVFHHFGGFKAHESDMVTEARMLALNMGGQVWWRRRAYLRFPFLFAAFVLEGVSQEEKLRLACSIWYGCEWCLDRDFTLRVKRLFPGPHAMLSDSDFMPRILRWAREVKLGDMWIERLFALLRSASPDKRATVARIISVGALSMLLRAHTTSGGKNGFKYDREVLLKQDVPLDAQESWERRTRSESRDANTMVAGNDNRGMTAKYANAMVSRETKRRAALGERTRTKAEVNQLRSEFAKDRKTSPIGERRQFRDDMRPAEPVVRQPGGSSGPSGGQSGPRKRDEHALWGVNDDVTPLREDVCAESVRKALGIEGDDMTVRGFATYMELFRTATNKRLFHAHLGDIPRSLQLERHYTCWDAHPDCCVTADRVACRLILKLAGRLRDYALAKGRDGHFCALRAELPPGLWHVPSPVIYMVLAFKRGSDPERAVWAQAGRSGEIYFEIRFKMLNGGHEVLFQADAGVVKRLSLREALPRTPFLFWIPRKVVPQLNTFDINLLWELQTQPLCSNTTLVFESNNTEFRCY